VSAAAIQIESLNVVRGDQQVIHDLSTQVRTGEITGLLGPSGCGKSTLMRSIVGVQIVRSGTVTVLGEPAGSATLRRRVGYVTQAPSVYTDLTIKENLQFFAAVLGVGQDAIAQAAESVGLGDRLDSLAGRLSGGQRSRVSLAVALLTAPDVLVLDEPTVGLDPVLRRQLWDTFDELAAAGAALIVSSHVMDEAERCHRLLLMREGRLIADDPPASLLERTGTTDVESAFLALVEEGGAA
jgi:ABC-2 type transport system ATP-binding protein